MQFGYLAIYQLSFFIFISTIGLNIIFGIIVDTFSELRDKKWTAGKDMRENCFICGLPCYEFEHKSKGFIHHTKFEHNMWAYIHYFIYLSNTSPNDHTALDAYVAKKRAQEAYDFFPQNKALSLASSNQTNETNKIDLLSGKIQYLIDIHKKEVCLQSAITNSKKDDCIIGSCKLCLCL
ncbi:hypothetical protein CAPTEDRAFT_142014 [Capitella teleta]|uniref:Ion transport domain-containing protein n=1 Tax=Capitella teleta TaxID=283909 RepID=R7U611_CAPTE|nr:hypothetical protein CAPTEDRAFT_142014 [Capitella teleta]|eukprot:ELT99131.1 hypothetical protein CAPTEDRAFT_142014 [Capitella teleta]